MNLLIEQGVIEEVKCGSDFMYILNNSADLFVTDYKVLQSQSNDYLIKCIKTLFNGKTALYYQIGRYKPLSAVLSDIGPDKLTVLIANVFKSIAAVKSNDFLSCINLDDSVGHIFVDEKTQNIRFVYLPLTKHSFKNDACFEKSIRSILAETVLNNPSLTGERVSRIVSDLQDDSVSAESFVNASAPRTDKMKINSFSIEKKPEPSSAGTPSARTFMHKPGDL